MEWAEKGKDEEKQKGLREGREGVEDLEEVEEESKADPAPPVRYVFLTIPFHASACLRVPLIPSGPSAFGSS